MLREKNGTGPIVTMLTLDNWTYPLFLAPLFLALPFPAGVFYAEAVLGVNLPIAGPPLFDQIAPAVVGILYVVILSGGYGCPLFRAVFLGLLASWALF
jgi:hypothetical protein